MTTNKPATPLPWSGTHNPRSNLGKVHGSIDPVCATPRPNDATYIVAACNAYPALVAALRESLQAYEGDFGPMHISTRHRALLRSLGEEA